MEVIEIANGVVTLVEKNVVKSITIRSFKSAMVSTLGFQTPILPAGTVLYGQRDGLTLYVLEQAPCSRTIRFRKELAKNSPVATYTIRLPWVYFVVKFHSYALEDLHVYFRPARMERDDDEVFYAPLPNTYDDGHVCLGDFRFDVTSSIPSRVSGVTTFYWGSVFNSELHGPYLTRMPKEIEALAKEDEPLAGWEKLPEEQVCQVGWQRYQSLGRVLESVMDRR